MSGIPMLEAIAEHLEFLVPCGVALSQHCDAQGANDEAKPTLLEPAGTLQVSGKRQQIIVCAVNCEL